MFLFEAFRSKNDLVCGIVYERQFLAASLTMVNC